MARSIKSLLTTLVLSATVVVALCLAIADDRINRPDVR
jgi:hypothetical protein